MPRHSRSQPAPERSEEDRERDREARERRRNEQGLADGQSKAGWPSASPPLPPPAGYGERAAGPASARPAGPSAPARQVGDPQGRRRGSLTWRLAVLAGLAVAVGLALLLVHALSRSRESRPPPAPAVVRVVIPEGETRAQIAQIAAAEGLTGSYRAASVRSELLNPTAYGAPAKTPNLEGFLFPATYDLYLGAPASRLVDEQLEAFKENFGPSLIARAHALGETPYQLLTVASMVEREARVASDRPKVAAVIYNRLRLGMPLGIDATIYYALELRDGITSYSGELTEAQLHIDSPYNTRLHTGLPPTPISNPGLASIEAAAYPAHVSFLYYVAAANGCGAQIFSTTPAQFEVDAAAYRAAVRRNGGHPPSCKGT